MLDYASVFSSDQDQKWIQKYTEHFWSFRNNIVTYSYFHFFHFCSRPSLLRWRQRRRWWRLATVKLWVFCKSNGVQVPPFVQSVCKRYTWINTFLCISIHSIHFHSFSGFCDLNVNSGTGPRDDSDILWLTFARTDAHCQLFSDVKSYEFWQILVRLLFPERRRRGWRLLRARWRLQPENPWIGRSVLFTSPSKVPQFDDVWCSLM